MITKLRRVLGLETDTEKLFHYQSLILEYEELSKSLDELSDHFYFQKKKFDSLLKSETNEFIIGRVNDKYKKFVDIHKEEIRKSKKKYDSLKSEISKIDFRLRDFNKIKGFYRSGLLDLEKYESIIKKLSNQKKTHFSDFILFNNNDEILLLKRAKSNDKWVIPGGHVDPLEDFETAAKRELKEESGYDISECNLLGVYEDDEVVIHYFTNSPDSYKDIDTTIPLLDFNETLAYKWVKVRDIDNYDMIFNMKENINNLINPNSKDVITLKSFNKASNKITDDDKGFILNEKLNSLNLIFSNTLLKQNRKIDFLIEKGFIEEANNLKKEIEKAKKDITKLNRVKKLFYRNGKLILGTVYRKTGEEIFYEDKQSHPSNIDIDVEEGKIYEVVYGKGKSKKHISIIGQAQAFGYSKKDSISYFCIVDDDGNNHWVSNKNIVKIVEKQDQQVQKEEYKFIKGLGGSTGAQLVQDKFGNKFVKKTGKDKSHIDIEYQALRLYHILGVKVPKIHKYDKDSGELYTHYIDPAIPILSSDNFTRKEISKDFGVDCLLANWDVVGLNYDNILHTPNGFYRVDVGGSLTKRAQGGDKNFGEVVGEFNSLLDSNINYQSAAIFKDVDVQESIIKTVQRYDAIKHYINKLDYIDDSIKSTLEKRVDYMRSLIKVESPEEELEKLNFKGKLYDIDSNYYNKDIVDFYDKLNEQLKIDEEDLKYLSEENDFSSEKNAKDAFLTSLKSSGNIYSHSDLPHLVTVALKNGVTWRELLALHKYTAGWSIYVNNIVTSCIDFSTGNLNFEKTDSVKDRLKDLPGKSYHLSFTKLICNSICKLEKVRDREFFVEGLFNRGIDSSKYGYQFDYEHERINSHVVHSWGSSSSWNNVGFSNSRDTVLKIVGSGIHIDSISRFKGSVESEVLHRPFTLFKVINFIPSNSQGKKEITLMKLI